MAKKPTPAEQWPADKIVRVPLNKLIPNARNARTHSDEQIALIRSSMYVFGWTIPCLVDEDGGIIAGHGRVLAAAPGGTVTVNGKALEWKGFADAPCMTARGWSEEKRRAYIIADNQLTLRGGWDDALLREEVRALADLDFDLDLLGFEADDLAELLADKTAGLTDPDDAPPAPENPVSIEGDVWLLGSHRITCGDSTKADDVARALKGAKPHLMVTDPPYGVKYDPSWRTKAGVGSEGAAVGKVLNDDRADWREAWALFPGNVCYVWHGGLHASTVAVSLQASKFEPRAQIIWVKTRPALSRGHYHWQHEPAFYAVKPGADDKFAAPEPDAMERFDQEHEVASYSVLKGKTATWKGNRKQSTVWFIEHLKSDTGHGTQKPVDCMKRPIENNSVPGQAIYEPFSGSGTTLIACEMTARSCHAIELSPAYVDVAVLRWQAFTGKVATLESSGATFEDVGKKRLARSGKRKPEDPKPAKAKAPAKQKAEA